ncbi:MAG: DUF1592 domain-containing protein [Polyangiaceae bacterium]|nr:DUF1592 domain-containing protein [Polyangiaceae bacterium]
MRLFSRAGLLAALLASGCQGSIGDPLDGPATGPDDPSNPLTFECTPGADPSATDIKRLTTRQYENTLRDLLAALPEADREAIMASLDAPLGLVPADVRDKDRDYVQMDESVSQSHVDGYYAVGRTFGAGVTETSARLGAFVGACAVDADIGNDAACVDAFIERFGALAMRRPLTADEVAFFRDEIYAVEGPLDPRGVVDVVTALLMSPQFSFHIENGSAPVEGREDLYQLTGYEIAARLSYHFWQTMPDAQLMEAAANGALETEEGFASELARVFEDPRTQLAVDDFYRQWLKLDDLPNMLEASGLPDYQAFAGDDLPGPDFRANMAADAQNLLRYYTWATDGGFDEVFLSNLSFATTPDLAAIYGVPVWSGEGEPPALPEGQRAGLLTRVALVANNKKTTRPIMKGAFIRKRLLCDPLELPANMNNMSSNLEVDSELSTRQRVEALTEQSGAACSSCHAQLNPLGYTTESYDGLGRYRTAEKLYDAQGNLLAEVPVDTSAVPEILSGDEQPVADALELSELLVDSGKAHACFARHYFRFTTGRREDFAADGCVLEELRRGIVEGGSLREMLVQIAARPEFRLRKQGA